MALEVQSVGIQAPHEWLGVSGWVWLIGALSLIGIAASIGYLLLKLRRFKLDWNKMQTIWHSMPDVVTEVDANGIILQVNQSLSPDVSVDQLIGTHCDDYLDEEGQAKFRSHLNRALNTGHKTHYEVEIVLNGQSIYLQNTIIPLNSAPEPRVLVIASDITRYKDAQRILQQDKLQSERVLHSKARFLTNVSQEMQGGMAILVSTIKQVASKHNDQHIYTMQASVEHLSQIVADMAVLAQSEKGSLSLESVNTSLWHILDDLEALYRGECEQQQIRLTLTQGPLPHNIMTDAFRLRQVLYNLIRGHLRICERKELILDIRQVSLAQEQVIQFTITHAVADGDGNLWETFFNHVMDEPMQSGLDSTSVAAFKFSQNLMSHLNGVIGAKVLADGMLQQWFTLPFQWVKQTDYFSVFMREPVHLAIHNDANLEWFKVYFESLQLPYVELGVGQSFPQTMSLCVSDYCQPEQARWLWWLGHDYDLTASQGIILEAPYRRESLYYRLTDYQNAQYASNGEGSPGRVLLVEDNLNNQLVIKRTLEKLGYQVVVANNGQEGVEKFKSHAVDCVIMDIQMPIMDGIEATQEIRKLDTPYVPVIALTANAQKEVEEACFAAGMDSFLTKPISRVAIQRTLEAFIGKQSVSESSSSRLDSGT